MGREPEATGSGEEGQWECALAGGTKGELKAEEWRPAGSRERAGGGGWPVEPWGDRGAAQVEEEEGVSRAEVEEEKEGSRGIRCAGR